MSYRINPFTGQPDQIGNGGGGGGGGATLWQQEPSSTVSALVGKGYICTNVGLTTISLPSTAAVGSVIEIIADSAGGFQVIYGAGQKITFGLISSTTSSGRLESTEQGDSLRLVCTTADTTWHVVSSVGNFNLV